MNGFRRPGFAAIVLTLLVAASPAAFAEVAAVPANAAAIVDAYLAAWTAHDAAKTASFFADDVVYYEASAAPQGVKGRDAARKAVVESFMNAAPDLTWTRDGEAIVGKDAVAFQWTFSGTNTGAWSDGTKATGKKFSFKGVTVLRFAGEKIVWEGDYYDSAAFLKQIGL